MAMHRTIDEKIDLTQICKDADWHHATVIDALIASGLDKQDASAFVEFIFAEAAIENGGKTETEPEECVTDDQWNRLGLMEI